MVKKLLLWGIFLANVLFSLVAAVNGKWEVFIVSGLIATLMFFVAKGRKRKVKV